MPGVASVAAHVLGMPLRVRQAESENQYPAAAHRKPIAGASASVRLWPIPAVAIPARFSVSSVSRASPPYPSPVYGCWRGCSNPPELR